MPVSQNGYSYVHGNPVNYTDPKGECVFYGIDTLICATVGIYGLAYLAATPNTPSININSSLSLPDFSQIVSPRHQNEQIALLALVLAITQSDVLGFSESFPAEAPNIPFVGGFPLHPPMLNIPTGFDLIEDPCWLEQFSPSPQLPGLPGFDLQPEIGPQILMVKTHDIDDIASFAAEFDNHDCLNCVDSLNKRYPGKGQSVLVLNRKEQKLLGQDGEDIGAPWGWHVVWVENSSLTVIDNRGNQGPLGTYVTNMKRHNDLVFRPMPPEKIEGLIIK